VAGRLGGVERGAVPDPDHHVGLGLLGGLGDPVDLPVGADAPESLAGEVDRPFREILATASRPDRGAIVTEPLDIDIVQLARSNDAFRREVATGEHSQIVAMTIPAGGEIGEEVHEENDQLLVFIDGEGDAVLDGRTSKVTPNDLVMVPAGTRHNFINTGDGPLRLVTVYAPPEHAPGTVHLTKEEADGAEGH
jgi:mannose-6-phosphate isomerase-like protein (cupin superfamily)